MSLKMEFLKEHVEALYHALIEFLGQAPEAFHFNHFKLRDGELCYRTYGKSKVLTMRLIIWEGGGGGGGGKLRTIAATEMLGVNRLYALGFDILVGMMH